jgi:transcriptional regulator NrdR family protein
MICPTCKKHTTSIVSEKYDKKTNSVKRNRYCVCGNSFDTYEKIKRSVKRKPKDATEWKNARICLYAVQRLADCLEPITEELSHLFRQIRAKDMNNFKKDEIKKLTKLDFRNVTKFFAEGVTKKGGKNFYQLPLKERDFFRLFSVKEMNKVKFVNKIESINRIVKEVHYWEGRNLFLNKPIKDMENKSLVRKEIKEYYKSVCDYIKQPQYNKDFFIQHQPQMTETWNKYWYFFLKIR